MSNYIGIDLGTTYSAVATIDDAGRPIIIENENKIASPKGNITASALLLKDNGLVVGDQARKVLGLNPNAVGRFKRIMGTSEVVTISDQDYTPTELSALVLAELKRVAETEVDELAEVVITIPANFSNEARAATMAAAKTAGLDVKHLINEPTAAALHYAFKNGKSLDGIYAVYDLGGGTFDISIIEIAGSDVQVIASNGIARLGGDDFDRELIKLVQKKYLDETGEVLDDELYTLTDAETDKIALSKKKKIVAGGDEQEVDGQQLFVTRTEFEEAISSLLAQAELTCEASLTESQVDKANIQGVILVGGSTRMQCVAQSAERIFGHPPITTENPDEAVALGAALYAAMKSDGENLSVVQKKAVSKVSVADVANHFFGTIVFGELAGQEALTNSIIIKKGTKIPCSVTESYYTVRENQTQVDCTVTQSANPEEDPRWVVKVWEGELELPPNRPARQEVQITYSYDDSQIMHCTFKDVASGNEMDAMISQSDPQAASSAIDKFLVD